MPADELLQITSFALKLLAQGRTPAEVEAALCEKGVSAEVAAELLPALLEARTKAIRRAGKIHLLVGAAWCLGGAIVTWATYSAANQGGAYVIAWGAIIGGGCEFLFGCWKILSTK